MSSTGRWGCFGGGRVGSCDEFGNLRDGYTIDEIGAPVLDEDAAAEAMADAATGGGRASES